MNLDTAKSIRNVLFKSFLITFVLLILSHIVWCVKTDFVLDLIQKVYGVAPEQAKICVLNAYTAMKILGGILFLIPAIAIQMEFFCPCKCKGACKIGEEK